MLPRKLPESVVIVGAGPAGLFTARRFKQLGVKNITIIEKLDVVGGKCSTASDPIHSEIKSERGAAAIGANYGVVLDAINEKEIKTERILPAKSDTVEINNIFYRKNAFQKAIFSAEMSLELWKFKKAVCIYKNALDKLNPLPSDLNLPFSEYAKKHGLNKINILLKSFVPGFGYGSMDDCPTYSILEYLGYTTISELMAGAAIFHNESLVAIQGGFQHLMERIAEDFDVHLSSTVTNINREITSDSVQNKKVTVTYTQNNEEKTVTADAFVLAISPLHWNELGMPLTATEKECTEQVTYYRYPIAICKIKGVPPNEIFVPEALEKSGFGHLALLTTRDNRENPADGRFCTVYVNLKPGKNDFSLEVGSDGRMQLIEDLAKLPYVESIRILETKIWEDYFSSLPWNLRLKLEREQYNQSKNTFYVGSYVLGSFEDVACIANRAAQMLDKCFNVKYSCVNNTDAELRREFNFFTRRNEEPITDARPELNYVI